MGEQDILAGTSGTFQACTGAAPLVVLLRSGGQGGMDVVIIPEMVLTLTYGTLAVIYGS